MLGSVTGAEKLRVCNDFANLILTGDGSKPLPATPVPLREVVLDELVEALVLFDLLQNELTGETATPYRWMAPHLARISSEIGTLLEQLGD